MVFVKSRGEEKRGREGGKRTTAQEIWAALRPGKASTTLELASRARAVPRKFILGVLEELWF